MRSSHLVPSGSPPISLEVVPPPPSKLKVHLKWLAMLLVGAMLVAVVSVLLAHAVAMTWPFIVFACVGGVTELAVVSILWRKRAKHLNALWEKDTLWRKAPAVTRSITSIRDVLFNAGDASELGNSYEHLEGLVALKKTCMNGRSGYDFVKEKLEATLKKILNAKVNMLEKWLEWAEDVQAKKNVCRSLIQALVIEPGTRELKFTDEHLVGGVLYLPKTRGLNLKPIIEAMPPPMKDLELSIDLSNCVSLQGFGDIWQEADAGTKALLSHTAQNLKNTAIIKLRYRSRGNLLARAVMPNPAVQTKPYHKKESRAKRVHFATDPSESAAVDVPHARDLH